MRYQRIDARDGQVIAVLLPGRVGAHERLLIMERALAAFDGHPVLILDPGVELRLANHAARIETRAGSAGVAAAVDFATETQDR